LRGAAKIAGKKSVDNVIEVTDRVRPAPASDHRCGVDNLRDIADIYATRRKTPAGKGVCAMDKTLIPSIISAVVAVFAAAVAIWGQVRVKRVEADLALQKAEADRRAETERTVRRFREPLGRAAYDLQSRIFNIFKSDFLSAYLRNGNERTRSYALKNTVFVIAQYFAWTELVRREIQFIDLGVDEQTRQLTWLQDNIYSIWQADKYDPLLRIFAGEQRAIGERLIREGPRGPECMGYASFLDFYKANPDALLGALEAEITSLGTSLDQVRPRLVALQHALIDLLAFFDPAFVRFPQKTRTKLEG